MIRKLAFFTLSVAATNYGYNKPAYVAPEPTQEYGYVEPTQDYGYVAPEPTQEYGYVAPEPTEDIAPEPTEETGYVAPEPTQEYGYVVTEPTQDTGYVIPEPEPVSETADYGYSQPEPTDSEYEVPYVAIETTVESVAETTEAAPYSQETGIYDDVFDAGSLGIFQHLILAIPFFAL